MVYNYHVGFISLDNQPYMFGDNSDGQLGRRPPYLLQRLEKLHKIYHLKQKQGIINIKCGDKHTIVKSIDNQYYSFGLNTSNQLCIKPPKYDTSNTHITKPTLMDIEYIKKLTNCNGDIIDIIPGKRVTFILQKRYQLNINH